MEPVKVTIPIEGNVVELLLDGNAYEAIEKATGRSIIDQTWQPQSATDLRLLVWACLQSEKPELTLEQVGASMGLGHLPYVLESVGHLMQVSTDGASNRQNLAPYVPTPEEVANYMATYIKPGDTVMDIGCGEGNLLLAAYDHEAGRLIGYESDEGRANTCREVLKKAGATDPDIRHANVMNEDGSVVDIQDLEKVDVLMLYLLNTSNVRLRNLLEAKMKPGAIVVSHDFAMAEWEPLERKILQVPNSRKHIVWAYRIGAHRKA